MKPDFFTKSFKKAKITQLILLSILELFYLLVILIHSGLRKQIFGSPSLLMLSILLWVFFLCCTAFLFYDFSKLRLLAKENHMLSQLAYLDTLTGIPNRYSLDLIFRIFRTPASVQNIGCMVIKITNLREINTTFSHETGDRMIQDFCSIFEEVGDRFGYLGRNGGNEFVIVIEHCLSERAEQFLQSLNQKIDAYNQEHIQTPICITVASVLNSDAKVTSFKDLLSLTYDKLQTL